MKNEGPYNPLGQKESGEELGAVVIQAQGGATQELPAGAWVLGADFDSIDPIRLRGMGFLFNWGLPGGSYSDPNGLFRSGMEPFTRIPEYKNTRMEQFTRVPGPSRQNSIPALSCIPAVGGALVLIYNI